METPKSNFTIPAFLAVTMTIGFFVIVGILLFHEIPEGSRSIVAQLIGGIAASVGAIVGYHYGSSSGSAAHSASKDALMDKIAGTGDGTGNVTKKSKTTTESVTVVDTTVAPTAWSAAKSYTAGDLVTVGTQKYRALADHTAGADEEPGVGTNWPVRWERVP